MSNPFVLVPHWPSMPKGVAALSTTRCGGFSTGPYDDGRGGGGFNLGLHCGDDTDTVYRNRERLQHLLPGQPAWLSQVHGAAVADAAKVLAGEPARADASVATEHGVVCAVMTADCLPVILADTAGKVVGAAHAGWRGLAAGVLGATVGEMRARGAADIVAWMGPAIGPGQFEVGQDVLDTFMSVGWGEGAAVRKCFATHQEHDGKYLADIYALARIALAAEGVTDVAGGTHCTYTERETFYSYRRDHVTGRQATLVWLR
ncbi:peptidoglycan editing factor PgeF [Pseudoduganella sp. GCM10020061]|uniref:peptidoglycan editing factor PgeF n=1 Tax=Pseudoduganella sp. GCM10020061 TaxID=3317345 RepID=UPI00363EE383